MSEAGMFLITMRSRNEETGLLRAVLIAIFSERTAM